jgi:TonB family protein
MSKALKRLIRAALAASLCACVAAAQQAPPAQSSTGKADRWVVVSPKGEEFGVLMSEQPASVEQRAETEGLSASGQRYAAADGQTTFTVWSLRDMQEVGARLLAANNSAEGVSGETLYLDRLAQLAWELLITPEFERLKREGDTGRRAVEARVGMDYIRQFKLSERAAREYSVRLEKEHGLVYVCADGARIYVVVGLTAAMVEPRLKPFADSFTLDGKPRLPESATSTLPPAVTIQVDPSLVKPDPNNVPYGMPRSSAPQPSSGPGTGGGVGMGTGTGMGPGRGSSGNTGGGDLNIGGGGPGPGGVDYSRPFRQNEVTRKAVITFKPEPGFTEWARRFNVTGVVRLRAILHSSGTMQSISVVKSLPHGLTRKALDAARQMRFQPAQKDGQAVSQYIVLEYNYNIY